MPKKHLSPQERTDPKDPKIDEKFIAQCVLNIQYFPEKVFLRAQQVFSKYPHKDIKKMGFDFMKMYQQLHAVEKPGNIKNVRLFVNTESIIKNNKDEANKLIYLHSKNISREEIEEKLNEKKNNQKIQKQYENKKEEEQYNENEEKIIKQANNSTNIQLQLIQYTQNASVAYLLRKAPHTFGVACRILNEIKYRLPNFQPQTFLDFGAGIGSGSIAFNDTFPNFKHIIACEPSTNMRKLGKHMTQDIKNLVFVENLAQTISFPFAQEYDIIYIGHVLQEVPSPESRLVIIDSLWNKLKKGGLIVFVENGSPKGFRFAHDFRKYILEEKKDEKPLIIAPCPHHGSCPLSEKDDTWCHFEQKIGKYPKKIIAKDLKERQFDDEKFCYIVIQKNAERSKNIDEDFEKMTLADQSFFWDRIIFPTMKKQGHVIYDLCTQEGQFVRRITAKSHGQKEYRMAKKLNWGDLWPIQKRIPNKFRKEGAKSKRLW
ncbi:mitochondrial ribosomal protein s22, putative [Ichthyophthirius multifiliis]|uniref:Mitochondrial ribosomal protein s22, putative n=1 Tax=Ichthyophthirius multifiliis TaxID=5932 RepID=G0R309_ICHMU|nr:mitochondrial ribosomal protein s22, putative [Ichthyophthirius multifiliis]EGR28141.1 mitochondrial ribosomal protein s22, putative [Ichthyophthirius multifiliis]|eukprot:XP_004027486.1 mitochondrial ribosomal protein s22, putative [Ichthyophthirius multifiliis]